MPPEHIKPGQIWVRGQCTYIMLSRSLNEYDDEAKWRCVELIGAHVNLDATYIPSGSIYNWHESTIRSMHYCGTLPSPGDLLEHGVGLLRLSEEDEEYNRYDQS